MVKEIIEKINKDFSSKIAKNEDVFVKNILDSIITEFALNNIIIIKTLDKDLSIIDINYLYIDNFFITFGIPKYITIFFDFTNLGVKSVDIHYKVLSKKLVEISF